MINDRGIKWPASLFEGRIGSYRLPELVRQIVRESWPEGFDEVEEKRDVGRAGSHTVRRTVTVFGRIEEEPDVPSNSVS